MAVRDDEEDLGLEEGLDLDVLELIVDMARQGLQPAMIVFLGDRGSSRVATRGVDPAELLRDLARESVAGRPCRRGTTTRH